MGISRVQLVWGGGEEQERNTFGYPLLPWTGKDASAAGLERKMGLVMFPKGHEKHPAEAEVGFGSVVSHVCV